MFYVLTLTVPVLHITSNLMFMTWVSEVTSTAWDIDVTCGVKNVSESCSHISTLELPLVTVSRNSTLKCPQNKTKLVEMVSHFL